MKILVANLGSTSFKFRLLDVETDAQLARGGIDRIGGTESRCQFQIGSHEEERTEQIVDHAAAMQLCLARLTDESTGCLKSIDEVDAVGFKTVHAGDMSGIRRVNAELLDKMESLSDVAPAHNPPYVSAMRNLSEAFPNLPLVASLETNFHETIPIAHQAYAIPDEWRTKHGVRKWGFHGASHRYISERIATLLGRDKLRVVSCHLGGSSSLCAIKDGKSVATSMGMSPQSGLPQNNRVGDFDPFALPYIMKQTGLSLEATLQHLATQSGLLGLSGLSGDLRDIEQAAAEGNSQAQLALDVYIAAIRQYLGGYAALMGGLDAIVFTGGIGENSDVIRRGVLKEMEWAGIRLAEPANMSGEKERCISQPTSDVDVWIVPTNEELIVARQAAKLLSDTSSGEDA